MLLLCFILLSIINVSARAVKDPAGLTGVGLQMLPAWEPSSRLDLSSPGPEEKSWKGALATPESQIPQWPGTIRLPLPSPQFPCGPLEASPSGLLSRRAVVLAIVPTALGKATALFKHHRNSLPGRVYPVHCPQLHPSTLKTFQATYPNSSSVVTPLPQACALACLQLLCCWPQRGSSRTTRECQQLRVLSNPGWMFSTYSLIFLSTDYCLTFLERQLEAPANF